MVGLLEAIFLGVIQGLTEWLPVSSSGHLVIVQEFFGIRVPLLFDIILHLGTVTVIFIFFRKDILSIVKAILKRDFKSQEGLYGLFIIVGSIPIAVSGVILYDFIESLFSNLIITGFALLVTGSLLYISKYSYSKKKLNILESFVIGIAQAIALIPGISRSGFTIGIGILRGVKSEEAFRFSFLLATPAIIGAALFDIASVDHYNLNTPALLVGFLVAMVIGYFSLKLLSRIILEGRLHYFSIYCWAAGVITIIMAMIY